MNRCAFPCLISSRSAAWTFVILACVFLSAQAPPPMISLPAPSSPNESHPSFRMLAVYAHGSGPQENSLPEELNGTQAIWKAMPYSIFEVLADQQKETPVSQETLFPINAIYSLAVVPRGKDEAGAVLLEARVDMLQGDTYVCALNSTAQTSPGQALIFKGMPLQAGELVLILALNSGEGQGQGNSEENQPPDTPPEGQQESQESDADVRQEDEPDSEDDQIPQSDRAPQPAEEDSESPQDEKPGVDNIQALLQSLEEMDRKEQMEERNRRDRIDFKGGWW